MAVFIAGQKSRGLLRSQARMTQVCKRKAKRFSSEMGCLSSFLLITLLHRSAFPAWVSLEGQKPQSVSAAGLTHRQMHRADTNLNHVPEKLISDRQER